MQSSCSCSSSSHNKEAEKKPTQHNTILPLPVFAYVTFVLFSPPFPLTHNPTPKRHPVTSYLPLLNLTSPPLNPLPLTPHLQPLNPHPPHPRRILQPLIARHPPRIRPLLWH